MNPFDFAYERTAEFEGILSNHKYDRGGKTKYGVTESTWLDYWKKKGQTPPCKIEDATQEQTKILFYEEYWLLPKLDQVAGVSSTAATLTFDACVHHGQRTGVKLLQQACNFLGSTLVEDGLIGPLTLAQLRYLEGRYPEALDKTIRYMRAKRLDWIAHNVPNQLGFLRGWMKRA